MSRFLKLCVLSIGALSMVACSTLNSPSASLTKTKDGLLVGSNDMTLYTFAKDVAGSGKSTCVAQCAVNWPPLLVDAKAYVSGDYSLVSRDDGTKQLAFKGMPLYFWVKDTKPGDKTGDGRAEGAWRLARN
jgi:predicted lipoprotein with Yx(FWY)xxD motif